MKGRIACLSISLLLLAGCTSSMVSNSSFHESPADVLAIIQKANGYWQQHHVPQQRAFWDEAAYHTGNMTSYEVTGNKGYLNYSETWATYNHCKGAQSPLFLTGDY